MNKVKIDQITEGQTYVNEAALARRFVSKISDGVVYYRIEGLATFVPLKASIYDFAAWATKPVLDRSARQT